MLCMTWCGLCVIRAFAKASFVIWLMVMISVINITINFLYASSDENIRKPPDNTRNVTLPYTGFSVVSQDLPSGAIGNALYCNVGLTILVLQDTVKGNLYPDFTTDYTTGIEQTISIVFGVLFNGCTGIMAGANMSVSCQPWLSHNIVQTAMCHKQTLLGRIG